jgi:serine/threonine protein kinase
LNAEHETSSSEVLLHLAGCRACQDRISDWNEQPRLDAFLQAAGNSEVAYLPPDPVEIAPGQPDALTNAYGLTPLRTIGQYQLFKSIGRGGGGEVFEARHTLLHRRVAIKLLSRQHSGSEVARHRFFREMESIGQLDDPNIVHAYDAGEVDGILYLAMELVDGENVESLARRIGPLPVSMACEIIRQAAMGLHHIHKSGLVHRDLKPSNLLIAETQVKIADLGLALLVSESLDSSRLTGHLTVLGTADYMAPEQAEKSHSVDIRADIYSLGCTLFRLLAGRPPYADAETSTPVKKMWAHASRPIPDIRDVRLDIPDGLANLIRTLMAKDRVDRLSEPSELANALLCYCAPLEFSTAQCLTSQLSNGALRSGSSGKTKTEPMKADSTMALPSGVQSQCAPRRRHPWGIAIGCVTCVVIALSWWKLHGTTDAGRPPAPDLTQTDEPKSSQSPAPSDPSAPTGPSESDAAIVPKPKPPAVEVPDAVDLGLTARHWTNVFGKLPIEHEWPGRRGTASWRFDDAFDALAVHSDRSVRFIKLGDLAENDDVSLKVDIVSQARDGACGIFVGYQPELKDRPQISMFHVIQVQFPSTVDASRQVLVRRYHGILDGVAGTFNSTNNDQHTMTVSGNRDKLILQVHLKSDDICSILVNGQDCGLPGRKVRIPDYVDLPCFGPYGLIVVDGAFWFKNPQLIRR